MAMAIKPQASDHETRKSVLEDVCASYAISLINFKDNSVLLVWKPSRFAHVCDFKAMLSDGET